MKTIGFHPSVCETDPYAPASRASDQSDSVDKEGIGL